MTITSDQQLHDEERQILAEELALHEKVKIAVRDEALTASPDMGAIHERLKELRDEAITASERDLPALFQQLYTHHSLAARKFEKKLPDMRAPYFAHVRLVEGKRIRDIMIGHRTFISSKHDVTIVDWRHAAMAKVFFNYHEGDEYELELPGRMAIGLLEVRRVLAFSRGELCGITTPSHSLARNEQGQWQRNVSTGVPDLFGGAGTAVSATQLGTLLAERKLPDISALLDANQYEILNRDSHTAMLIFGGAGSGKTTIALHRMAALSYKKPKFYRQDSMMVIVPERGLVRFSERLLSALNLDEVKVLSFDDWVVDQGRHILKGIPKKLCQDTSSSIIGIKRHPAMLAMIDAYAGVVKERILEGMRTALAEWPDVIAAFAAESSTALWDQLDRVEQQIQSKLGQADQDQGSGNWKRMTVSNFLKAERARLYDVEGVRSEIFTHPAVQKVGLAAGHPELSERAFQELSRHMRRQYEESALKDIDREEAREVDGQDIEDDDYAGTMDVEDFAILLIWLEKIHGRVLRKGKSLTQYRHLVLDEAQDIAQIEHRVLGRSLAVDASLTIAGDAAQQSDATVAFRGFEAILEQLAAPGGYTEARLKTSYRCPRPICEYAHQVLGELAPAEMPQAIRDGLPVAESRFANDGLAVVALTEALTKLFERERLASVAVVCATEENARFWYEALANVDHVRLVVDGEFTFKPGIDVTDLAQVKGLEFDYIIIPDADAHSYPATPVARRALHIACTRAVHQLWVLSIGNPSPCLPGPRP